MTCRGECVEIAVSDNASVGKKLLNDVALPLYLVDQRFADVVLMVFLENNHGKLLYDILFGQLQSRRKRSFFLSVYDLLSQFEYIKEKYGALRDFALNSLSSVSFALYLSHWTGKLNQSGYLDLPNEIFILLDHVSSMQKIFQ